MTRLNCKGRSLWLSLSPRAARELAQLHGPLFVEMCLQLDDLARKVVRPLTQAPPDLEPHWVWNGLALVYRPLITADQPGSPSGLDLPIKKLWNKYPRWLALNHNGQDFCGQFGLSEPQRPSPDLKLPGLLRRLLA